MASGLTLVFGVMDIINVGQGALVILGAYLSYFLQQQLAHRPVFGFAYHDAVHVRPGSADRVAIYSPDQARPHHALHPGDIRSGADH